MDINITSPVKAYITFKLPEEMTDLQKSLTYTNTSIMFQLKKHNQKGWLKKKDPIGWEDESKELQGKLRTCLLQRDNLGHWIRPGTIPYIISPIDTVSSSIVYPDLKPMPWAVKPKFEPYQYQSAAVKELLSIKHGNISLPTGAGKSHILLMCTQQMGTGTVIVTPSKSIFNELLTEFQLRLGKENVGGYGDGKKNIKKPITIAIGKSLANLVPGTDAYKFFSNKKLMCVDESHTFASNQLNNVCHGVLGNVPYRFFVSATQTRGDGTAKLLQSIIGKNVLTMSLKEAIDQGFLCKLKFTVISTYSPSTVIKKDPIECKRTHLLYNEEVCKIIAKIANASWTIKKESSLILVEELRQIKMLMKYLNIPCSYVHSGDKREAARWKLNKVKLQDEVDKFNKGESRVLIGTRAIFTGTNIYPTHNVFNWIGGSSEIQTKQGPMGRPTRLLEISDYKDFHKPKPFSHLYDFKIKDQDILNKHLDKRVRWYKQSGGEVRFY